MQCSSCHVKRCSTEFPGTTLSETCEHPPTICLSCLRKLQSNLESLSHCPQCWEPLATADCQKLQAAIRHCDRACAAFEDLDILKEREQKAKEEANLDPMGLVGTRTGEIEVTVLDGRRCKLSLSKQMRLSEVMKQIQEMLGPALRAAKAVTQARLGMILKKKIPFGALWPSPLARRCNWWSSCTKQAAPPLGR
eukprot:g28099.t1